MLQTIGALRQLTERQVHRIAPRNAKTGMGKYGWVLEKIVFAYPPGLF